MNTLQNAQPIILSFAPSVLRAENKLKRVDYMETAKGSFSLEVMDPDNISGWRDEDPYFGSEKRGKNIILYDWFAMTSKIDSVESLIDKIGFTSDVKFEDTYGFYGYKNRVMFDGMSIHYNHNQKSADYPLIEFTGQGCRDFETYTDGNWWRLFEMALDTENYHVTRLDVAFDDHDGIFDIRNMVMKTLNREYVSKTHKAQIVDSITREVDSWSLQFGVRQSDMYCRVYDKARERGYTDGRHWIRCETVFKDEYALNFIRNKLPLGEKYCGILKNYLRFVEPNKSDSNKRRWKTSKFWDKFLGNCNKVKLYTPKTVDYNLSRIGRYVFHQAGNSVDTYIKCVGLTQFLEELRLRGQSLNVHQKRIINEYKARIAAENDNCNTSTPGAAPVLERYCNTNYVPAGDDWVTKGV